MAGKSPVTASEGQKAALETLAASKDRGEADRAHAVHAGFPIEPARVEAVLSSLHALYLREIERG